MFSRRLTLFKLLGFSVRIDLSWLFLAVLITWSLAVGYFPQLSPELETSTYWWMGIAGLIGLAASIILHELAHSLVARRYDMPIHGITLFIFGGVAEMQDEPSSPKGEFLMAAAGPLASLAIAALFWLLAGLAQAEGLNSMHPAAAVAAYLAFINAVLAAFNLIPAFPLDGGRMLRALLWAWKKDILWATRIASACGGILGVALTALSLLALLSGNPVAAIWWFLLGLFIRAAAASASSSQTAKSLLSHQQAQRFMRAQPVSVTPEMTLDKLVQEYFYRHYFKDFPVTRKGKLVGIVSLDQVKAVDPEMRWSRNVASLMRPVSPADTVMEDHDAAHALTKMQRNAQTRLLVTDYTGQLIGVLVLRDLINYLSLREKIGATGKDTRRVS